MNLSLAMLPREINATPLATSVTVGYAVAIVSRNSCRLRTLLAQILAICGPMIIGYAFWIPVANGLLYSALLVCIAIITMMMGIAANAKMTELFRANQKTSRIARYDVLTGLLNRFSFGDALETMLTHASNGFVESFAIITIDLDRFKEINDTLGHNIGDAVIVEMAARLTKVVGVEDIIARLGGDEFVVLAKGRRRHNYGVVVAERIVEAMSEPVILNKMPLSAGASVGVALYPDHASTAEELMKKSDIAMYEAKHGGRKMACVFDAPMQAKINDARLLELEMQFAIEQEQFEPWFQPIENIVTGQVTSYEALARWRHPQRGIIQPNRFIPIAEHNRHDSGHRRADSRKRLSGRQKLGAPSNRRR